MYTMSFFKGWQGSNFIYGDPVSEWPLILNISIKEDKQCCLESLRQPFPTSCLDRFDLAMNYTIAYHIKLPSIKQDGFTLKNVKLRPNLGLKVFIVRPF